MSNAASSLKTIENTPSVTDSDDLFIREKPPYGLGVFADRRFLAREIVGRFQGDRFLRREVDDFTHFIEVGYGEFLGPSGGVDDFFNHSCSPTTRLLFQGDIPELEAVRDIELGEEITFDYASCLVTDPTVFDCSCGSFECRGVIQSYLLLPRDRKRQLVDRGLIPRWVIESEDRTRLLRARVL
jgi:hypothetical protein